MSNSCVNRMTILFVSREAFRRGCMSKTRDHNWPQVINLLWLTSVGRLTKN